MISHATHQHAGIAALGPIKTRRNADIGSFASALEFLRHELGVLREGSRTQLAAHVTLRVDKMRGDEPTHISVVLYETPIVTYRWDETFTTGSGGHLTFTTVNRLNQFVPAPYRGRCSRSRRTLFLGGTYADEHANRFLVRRIGVFGKKVEAPRIIRNSSKSPHGRLCWALDDLGDVFSMNTKHPNEAVIEGDEGLERVSLSYSDFLHLRTGSAGLACSSVPIATVNAHRAKWGMPPIRFQRPLTPQQ